MTEEQRSEARREFEGIRDERGRYANTATRIGNALLLLLELIGGGESGDYLSKTMDDVAQGRITFLKGIKILLIILMTKMVIKRNLKNQV